MGTRDQVRKKLVNVFLEESPGTGAGINTSKYTYNVERTSSGERIYLTRPAQNNKGFDFGIHVENHSFSGRNKTMPKHVDIEKDLILKKKENKSQFNKLKKIIFEVYLTSDVKMSDIKDIKFINGLSVELVLLIIKWMFIEQDVTYWNYSGRNKFFDLLNSL